MIAAARFPARREPANNQFAHPVAHGRIWFSSQLLCVPLQGTHNNVIERDIRPFATARKSWLFSDTVAGAKSSAVVYSLMLTCRACGVEPHAWLLHVLTELP
ncbi:hypothetical protein WL22_27440 [Burkholderia ubonensis]|nr:hypothetical protein WL22_27440 [Burkholderia ubonensis]